MQSTSPGLPIVLDSGSLITGPSLLGAVLVLLATYIGVGLTRRWLGRAMRRARVDSATRILVHRLTTAGVIIFGLLTAFGILGVPPATIVTLLGAIGLAFSLATQDMLKNFFAGIYLLLERPFHVGDEIKVKDQRGTVEHVGVRTTILRTTDNVQVLVPNALVFAEVVTNHTQEIVRVPPGDLEPQVEKNGGLSRPSTSAPAQATQAAGGATAFPETVSPAHEARLEPDPATPTPPSRA